MNKEKILQAKSMDTTMNALKYKQCHLSLSTKQAIK